MRIQIYPIKRLYLELEKAADTSGAAAILCSSYSVSTEKVQKLKKVLVLCFDDTPDANRPRAFSNEGAERVADFVEALDEKTRMLYICCDSGESRSSAIACAVARHLGKDEMMFWRDPHYHPNPLVYTLQCQAFGLAASVESTNYKLRLNEMELKNAIRDSGN